MARKAEKERTRDGLKQKIVNPNAVDIDIAYGEYACSHIPFTS